MKETFLGISFVSIATGLFKLLLPETTFKKQIAFLTACFFVLSCVSLFGGETDISEITDAFRTEGAYVDFSAETDRMTQTEIANKLAENLNVILDENEISQREIRVVIDISSENSISIKQVRLAFSADNAYAAEKAEQLVKKEVGDDIEVVTEIRGG